MARRSVEAYKKPQPGVAVLQKPLRPCFAGSRANFSSPNVLQDFCSGAGGGGAFVAVVVVFEGGVFVGG